MPPEYKTWEVAERFGWTLDYVEGLPLARWHELIQIDDGRIAAGKSRFGK